MVLLYLLDKSEKRLFKATTDSDLKKGSGVNGIPPPSPRSARGQKAKGNNLELADLSVLSKEIHNAGEVRCGLLAAYNAPSVNGHSLKRTPLQNGQISATSTMNACDARFYKRTPL